MMKKWLAIGGLILVTVIWGGGFVASDMALGSMKPFQIMMVRFLLASVLMGMISMGQHKKEGKLENRAGAIKAGILMGIALFAGFAFQIIGLQYTTPSKNAFLTALNVVIVPFIAFIILKKKVGMKGIIGAIMSVIGVALLSLNGWQKAPKPYREATKKREVLSPDCNTAALSKGAYRGKKP
jgi:drug/metabolite transporter (DMT)-like permease